MATVGRIKNGDLLISGELNERVPVITNGLVAHYPFDGTAKGISYSSNKLDTSVWKVGTSGSQGAFGANGSASENQIISYPNPWNVNDTVWASLNNDATSDGDGGWDLAGIPIDPTKKYRLTVWIRRENVGNGRTYFGCQGNTVKNLSGTLEGNPYFAYALPAECPEMVDNWALFVAHIQPSGYASTSSDPNTGVYKMDGIKSSYQLVDYKWDAAATVGGHRTYLYYSTSTTERQYWYRPRFEVCDGNESTIQDLLLGMDDTINVSTNTNTTISPDGSGVAVEESTTNLVVNPSFSSGTTSWSNSSWDSVQWKNEYNPITGKNGYLYLEDKSAQGFYYQDVSMASNITVTASMYFKLLQGNINTITIGGTVFYTDSTYDDYTWAGGSWLTDLGNGIYKISRPITYSTTKTVSYHEVRIAHTDSTPTRLFVYAVQLEQKPYSTSFIEGSRSSGGLLKIPFNLKPPYTINMFHRSGKLLSSVVDQSTSPMIFHVGNDYYSNASISFWNYVKFLRLYAKGDTGADWSIVSSNLYSYTPSDWDNVEHMYTLVALDNINFKVYMDGVYKGTTTGSVAVTNINQNVIALGNTSMNDASYRDLSLYNRALSDAEVSKLASGALSIQPDGDTIIKSLVERPIGIPSDAYYLPLSGDAKDEFKLYNASSESNVVYENSYAWVGNAATNLVSNPSFQNGITGWSISDATGGSSSIDNVSIIGNKSLKVSVASGGDQYQLTTYSYGADVTGRTFTFSAYIKTSGIVGTGVTITSYWVDSGGSWIWTNNAFSTPLVGNNDWTRVSITVPAPAGTNQVTILISPKDKNGQGTYWIDGVMIEERPYLTPYTDSSRTISDLEFNFNRDLGLDWNSNWSIVYWKKPVGTSLNDLSGYSLESLGCNSNSVGGGYHWWGKVSGSNALNPTPANSTFSSSNYFGKPHMTSIVKSGTVITWSWYDIDGVAVRSATADVGTISSNRYVTQYGYDFKFGWDDINVCNTYYRDLIVVKRALTNTELSTLNSTQMRSYKNKLQIQNALKENVKLT